MLSMMDLVFHVYSTEHPQHRTSLDSPATP